MVVPASGELETKSGIELPDVEASVDVLAVVDVVVVVLPLLLPSLEVDVLAVVDVVAVVLPLLPSLEQTAMALNLLFTMPAVEVACPFKVPSPTLRVQEAWPTQDAPTLKGI